MISCHVVILYRHSNISINTFLLPKLATTATVPRFKTVRFPCFQLLTGVGCFAFAPFANYLLEEYGWQVRLYKAI
jgi:hypothetical protein